jgi:putative hydrolase of the HAD superfamily
MGFNKEKKLFIIDYDDTLAPNLHDYSESILKFVNYCINTFEHRAPDIPTIINTYDKIDKKNVTAIDPKTNFPFNFTARRFPTSLIDSFEYLAKSILINGLPFAVSDKHRDDLWNIGNFAFNYERYEKQGFLPGVESALDFLVSKGDDLKLVSKGDPWVQERKFSATNMKKWFGDNLNIVPIKTPDVLLELSKSYDLSNVYHIGNSMKSDVIPAINAGIGMIYVPLETWSYEKDHESIPVYNKLITINSLEEIKNIYPNL